MVPFNKFSLLSTILLLHFNSNINLINAESCRQVIQGKSELSQVAQDFDNNPAWSDANVKKTLIVPTNSVIDSARSAKLLDSNDVGVFYIDQVIDYKATSNYQVFVNNRTGMVFDNYYPPASNEIHLRSSTSEGLVQDILECDDGIVYVSEIVFQPAVDPSVALVHQPNANSYVDLFKKINAVAGLDSLKDVTIFAPNDDAVAAVKSDLDKLTNEQLAYVLKSTIAPNSVSSILLQSTFQNENNETLTVTHIDESNVINGVAKVTVSDTASSAGFIHVVDHFIIPSNIPTGEFVVTIGDWSSDEPNALDNSSNTSKNNNDKSSGSNSSSTNGAKHNSISYIVLSASVAIGAASFISILA